MRNHGSKEYILYCDCPLGLSELTVLPNADRGLTVSISTLKNAHFLTSSISAIHLPKLPPPSNSLEMSSEDAQTAALAATNQKLGAFPIVQMADGQKVPTGTVGTLLYNIKAYNASTSPEEREKLERGDQERGAGAGESRVL
jgi:hypothetical protein